MDVLKLLYGVLALDSWDVLLFMVIGRNESGLARSIAFLPFASSWIEGAMLFFNSYLTLIELYRHLLRSHLCRGI